MFGRRLALLLLFAVASVLPLQAMAAAANDNFVNSIEMPAPGPLLAEDVNTTGATLEPGEPRPCSASATLWFHFTTTSSETMVIRATGQVRPTLAIFTGPGLKELTAVNCTSGNTPTYARLLLTPTPGVTYRLQVGTLTTPGPLRLELEIPTAPANDLIANAESLTTSEPTVYRHTVIETYAATMEEGEPLPSCTTSAVARSIWYRIDVPAGSQEPFVIVVDGLGSTYSHVLAVYRSAGEGMEPAGCRSRLRIVATPGETYLIQFAALGTLVSGRAEFNLMPAPSEDDAAAARPVELPFDQTLDAMGATLEPDEPSPSCSTIFGSVWLTFTATARRVLNLNTASQPSGSIVQAVYRQDPEGLVEVSCSSGGSTAFRSVEIEPGATYLIQAAPRVASTISVRVSGILVTPAPNDDAEQATQVPLLPHYTQTTTSGATRAPEEPPLSCGTSVGATIWYQFTAPDDRAVLAGTIGTFFDTTIAVYEGEPGSLREVACNDDFNGTHSRVTFIPEPGSSYYVMAGGFKGARGTMRIGISHDPTNDAVADAHVVDSLPFVHLSDGRLATVQPGEPTASQDCLGGSGSLRSTIWYRFMPSYDGTFALSTLNPSSTTFPLAVVYEGLSFDAMTQVACTGITPTRTHTLTFDATAGVTYHIQLGFRPTATPGPTMLQIHPAGLPGLTP